MQNETDDKIKYLASRRFLLNMLSTGQCLTSAMAGGVAAEQWRHDEKLWAAFYVFMCGFLFVRMWQNSKEAGRIMDEIIKLRKNQSQK